MRSVFIILFILVSSQIAFPQQNSGRKYYFVAAKTGLVMRKTPSSDAEKLNVLPYAARVKVVDENGPVEKIGGKNAKWFKITDDYHYSFAWVFSGFLVSGLDELDQSRFEVFAMKFFLQEDIRENAVKGSVDYTIMTIEDAGKDEISYEHLKISRDEVMKYLDDINLDFYNVYFDIPGGKCTLSGIGTGERYIYTFKKQDGGWSLVKVEDESD